MVFRSLLWFKLVNYVALRWTRGISLKGRDTQESTLAVTRLERDDLIYILPGPTDKQMSSWGGTVRVGQSPEIDLASRSRSSLAPMRVWSAFRPHTREMGSVQLP